MSKLAIGMIETMGLAAGIEAADICLKAANINLVGYEFAKGSGMTVIKIEGNVGAVKAAIKDNVWMMTIHVSDFEGMRQCAEIAKQEAERLNIEKPIIVGVTVLTSLSNEDLQDIGCNMTTEELAIKRAKLAKKSGIDGVVCSAKEVDKIVEACGKDFVTVCPGIRPQSAAVGDQKRVVTPAQAIQNGAHYMVVGRPITQAENPKQSAIDIVKEIENA